MMEPSRSAPLPEVPGKRYFTIGEVSELCGVKPHVLRYWEQEFPQLRPVKRRGNRRYYRQQDVMMVRQIRSLLYEQGFTVFGARQQLSADQLPRMAVNAQCTAPASEESSLIRELEDLLALLRAD